MNCGQHKENLNRFLDGELEGLPLSEFQSHTAACGDCETALREKEALRQALKSMPLPPPDDGFYDRVLEQTVLMTHRNATYFWSSAGIGGAIAAGLVAWLVLALPADVQNRVEQPPLDTVTISLNVEKRVRLSFESVNELQGAMLTLQLPPGVEISGYDDRSEIRWATNVRPGTNILELPIVIRSGDGGTILARIEHGGKAKSFELAVKVI